NLHPQMRVSSYGRSASEDDQTVEGLGRPDTFAEHVFIDRHVSPAQNFQAFLARRLPPDAPDVLAIDRYARQEQLSDRIILRSGQGEADALGLIDKEVMRDLQKDAGAVARLGIGAHGAAVLEIAQYAEAIGDDLVALEIVDIGDEADAAGIVFVTRIIKAMRFRQAFWKKMGRVCH